MKHVLLSYCCFVTFVVFLSGCGSDSKTNTSGGKDSIAENVENSNEVEGSSTIFENFIAPVGDFSVNFPSEPVLDSGRTMEANGEMFMANYSCEVSEKESYSVVYTDYLGNNITGSAPVEVLNDAMDGFVTALGIEVEYSGNLDIQGYAGISFRAKGKAGTDTESLYVRDNIILAENRIYHVAIFSIDGYLESETENYFMDSFEFKHLD